MNENLSGVRVQKESLPSAPFSYRKKLNTSYGFGECQPILSRTIEEAQCTSQFAINTLIRLSPLIAPSFCEIKHKQYFAFVPLNDLTENVDHVLSHVPKALVDPDDPNNYITGYINEFPSIDQSVMLWYLLRDSRICVYGYNKSSNEFVLQESPLQDMSVVITRCFSNLHPWYRQNDLLNISQVLYPENSWAPDYGDYNFRYKVGDTETIITFRLSDAGKRLRKIFIGLGFRPSFGVGVKPNMLIIPAWFKMYFDIFNLPQFDNWLDSDCYKMLHFYDRYGTSDLAMLRVPISDWSDHQVAFARLFYNFVVNELSYCFYTEDKDFVSAHVSTSSLPARDLEEFSRAKFVGTQGEVYTEADHFFDNNFGAKTSQFNLTELDDKILKKLYRQINQESTIGYDIASILRTLGYDDYVDTCKSNYIGSVEQVIEINPVISQSGTSEKKLGDYAGYGVSYQNGHEFTYKNDEYGFLLGIGVMIPDSDYNSALDPSLLGIDRYTFGKDFDGYGFEPTPRACVGSQTIMDTPERSHLDATTFGYVPVGTHRKVSGGNILNGDMSLLSMRNTFLPYQLDRMIYDNPESYLMTSPGHYKQNNVIINGEFPQASKIWRYITRYPFLGQFNRIFYDSPQRFLQVDPTQDYRFGNMPDNFYAHNEVKCTVWKNQLPIDSTWQTIDDPSEHKPTLKVRS